jgi:hypothetical protein
MPGPPMIQGEEATARHLISGNVAAKPKKSRRKAKSADDDNDGKIELVRGLVDDENGMVELTFDPKRVPAIQFAVRLPSGEISYTTEIPFSDRTLILPQKPRIRSLITKPAVLLPSRCQYYGSQEDLVTEVTSFIHKYAEIEPEWEARLAYYVLLSWVYDRFTAIPYLKFEGEPDTGKSRYLDVLEHLCYRAVSMSGATTPSPIFRMIELFGGTLLLDEADYKFSDESDEITKILNCGYMQGKPVWRAEKDGDHHEPVPYEVFGPKIIAQRHPFKDVATETRCLTYRTKERRVRDNIPRQLPPEFYSEAVVLRNKLLQWRFDNRDRIEINEKPLLEMGSRATQIGAPLYSISNDPSFQRSLVQFLAAYEKHQKQDKPQAFILEALIQLYKNNPKTYTVKEIVERANEIVSQRGIETEELTTKPGGNFLSTFGFNKKRQKDGYHVVYNPELAERLAKQYSISFEE